MEKIRLDVSMVQQGLAESREKAKAMIMSGHVFVNDQREDKAGTLIKQDARIILKGNLNPYVSRGGLKLEKAMATYGLKLNDLVCMDIGASTGGFTDCMLQNGAVKVYAVDVGYGQLAWKLRQDQRVVVMEKTNIRNVILEHIQEPIDFFSVDVSFISLKKVLPVVYTLLNPNATGVCLIKPQFEAGRAQVGKKGVVRDPKVHIQVLEGFLETASALNIHVYALDYSPIKGPEGNIEYLAYVGLAPLDAFNSINTEKVVADAHKTL